MFQEIPCDYDPKSLEKIKMQQIDDYLQLEYLNDTQPELLTKHLIRKLNRLRKNIVRNYPDEYIC